MTASTTSPAHAAGASPSAALPPRARPPRAGALSASLTFGWRALLKLQHMPEQLIDITGIPVIFTLMFTYLFGGALAGSTRQYLQFLLPGSLVMAVVLITVYSGVTLNTDIAKGAFDRFRSLPISRPAPLVGALLGDLGRYLVASAIVASNIFVDPRTMPGWLRSFVDVNPVSHLVTAVRGLMAGTATAGQGRLGAAGIRRPGGGVRAPGHTPVRPQVTPGPYARRAAGRRRRH
jgi:hypothetical protein